MKSTNTTCSLKKKKMEENWSQKMANQVRDHSTRSTSRSRPEHDQLDGWPKIDGRSTSVAKGFKIESIQRINLNSSFASRRALICNDKVEDRVSDEAIETSAMNSSMNRLANNQIKASSSATSVHQPAGWSSMATRLLVPALVLLVLSAQPSSQRASSPAVLPSSTPSGEQPASSPSSTPQQTTTSYAAEPIKWSFGGWAPLDGAQSPKNSSQRLARQLGTSPMPSYPTPRPFSANRQLPSNGNSSRQAQFTMEALSESASQEKARFAQANEPPVKYSMPAPVPIVREQIIPSYAPPNNHHHHHHPMSVLSNELGRQQQQLARPQHEQQQHTPVQQQQSIRSPIGYSTYLGPSLAEVQRQNHQRHVMMMMQQSQQQHRQLMDQHQRRQQRMHHQYMVRGQAAENYRVQPPQQFASHHADSKQPEHQSYHATQQQQQHEQQQQQVRQMQQVQPQHAQLPLQEPYVHPQQIVDDGMRNQQATSGQQAPNQQQQQQHYEQPQGQVHAYKLIEGEQPIIFSAPIGQAHGQAGEVNQAPVLEVSGVRGNVSELQRDHQLANGQPTSQNEPEPAHGKAEPSAYQVVAYSEQEPSNNIQDIKHRQQLESGGRLKQQVDKAIGEIMVNSVNKKLADPSSYLTIPVAVETDGDKVLTSDDINEIEKHVINVLPNLKTADKIVKIADTQLSLAAIKPPGEQQQQHTSSPADTAQVTFDDHRTTMRQLENELNGDQRPTTKQQLPSTVAYGSSPGTSLPQPTMIRPEVQRERDEDEDTKQQDSQYLMGNVPSMQEAMDQDQMNDYNLIKNDLMAGFRYEPTRSRGHGSQSMPSTPPMSPQHDYQRNRQPAPTRAPALLYGQSRLPASRGRLPGSRTTNSYATSSSTIMGGRKVSDVMRPLIRTTPVPMTSPIHVSSVQPEKLDAIQFIAGKANERQPMVVDPNQLVGHTPDGGFDFSTVERNRQEAEPKQVGESQRFTEPPRAVYNQQQQQQQPQQQRGQYQGDQHGGAIVEYVTLGERPGQQVQQQQQQIYHQEQEQEQPQTTPHDPNSQRPEYGSSPYAKQQYPGGYTTTPMQQTTMAQYQRPTGPNQPPAIMHVDWSPAAGGEQQQQIELGNQQMDMPATAGYNYFNQEQANEQQSQQQSNEEQHQEQVHEDKEHEEEREEHQGAGNGRWRTKAGGSQPNADAQYDGQIAKPEEQPSKESYGQQQESGGQQSHEQHPSSQSDDHHQSTAYTLDYPTSNANNNGALSQTTDQVGRLHDSRPQLQVEQHYDEQYQIQQDQLRPTTRDSGYQPSSASTSYGQPTPSDAGYGSQATAEPRDNQLSYVRLDTNRQQAHLAQQQAQRQAHLAEMLDAARQEPQPQTYQTQAMPTTPMSMDSLDNGYANQTGGEQSVGQQQMPVLEQSSLIHDGPAQANGDEYTSDDDGAKYQQGASKSQPSAVYQVYQAYYAPKDHKPLPGYVRLSLDEFNELFKDAEIQYVDKNLAPSADQGADYRGQSADSYEPQQQQQQQQLADDYMRTSGSEQQSIVVDRRSISSQRMAAMNLTGSEQAKFMAPALPSQVIKKIISIRNVASKLDKPQASTTTTTATTTSTMAKETKQQIANQETQDREAQARNELAIKSLKSMAKELAVKKSVKSSAKKDEFLASGKLAAQVARNSAGQS